MGLTDVAVRKAKATDRAVKLADGEGLYLYVTPAGGRSWRWDYAFEGKRKTLTYGRYPEWTLAEARAAHADARKLQAHGSDPMAARKDERRRVEAETVNTFGLLADEYIERLKASGRSEATIIKARWYLEKLAGPLRERPVSQITSAEVLTVLRKIEASGRVESAHNLRGTLGSVFRFAISTLRAEIDPTYALRGALRPAVTVSRAAITEPARLGALMRALDDAAGSAIVTAALKFALFTAARPGEVRLATWAEIDLVDAVWRIPAERMKMKRAHDVPLSPAAAVVLNGMQRIADSRLVFPSVRSVLRPLSENTLNARLRMLGFTKNEATTHGFRASFSTLANESGKWSPDAIERQLAHVEGNAIRRAYNRAAHWDERMKLMDWWAAELKRYRTLK